MAELWEEKILNNFFPRLNFLRKRKKNSVLFGAQYCLCVAWFEVDRSPRNVNQVTKVKTKNSPLE